MTIANAIDDIKMELLIGASAADVIRSIAADYNLPKQFLVNRARAVLGDFETYPDRANVAKKHRRASELEQIKRGTLRSIDSLMKGHNEKRMVLPHSLRLRLIDTCQALGGTWYIPNRTSPRTENLDLSPAGLAALLREAENPEYLRDAKQRAR